VAVVAVPDTLWGERPLAVVVAKAGATLTLDTLNQPVEAAIADGTLPRYARLARFEAVEQLPRTSVGKIDKKAMRARYAEPTRP
jgi:fatty-acyl-CoA synthase